MSRRHRPDTLALIVGIVCIEIALVALWAAFAQVHWGFLGVAIPLNLVIIGGLGLFLSRTPKQGD